MNQANYWLLYGTEEYIYDHTKEGVDVRTEEKFLAVFTSREKAEEYAEASKAPTFRADITWYEQNKGNQFKRESLLAGSTGYMTYPLDTPTLEIDPKL